MVTRGYINTPPAYRPGVALAGDRAGPYMGEGGMSQLATNKFLG